MSKVVKTMVIKTIQQELGEYRDLVVVDTSALDGVSANRLRIGLASKGVNLLSVKNALANRALVDLGVGDLKGILKGPTTLVWGSEDVVQLSKEITKWAKDIDKLQIKGGTVDGQVIDASGVQELSKSPNRLELIAQISGLLLSPGARLSGALLGAGGKLAGQIKKLAEGGEDDAVDGDAAPAEATAE